MKPLSEVNLMPLYMSTIAGMSTCLGAAWVLLQRRPPVIRTIGGSKTLSKMEPVIPPSTMCFSLALAGSVMVTVSVVSIIPECLREEDGTTTTEGGGYKMIPLLSIKFLYRIIFHTLGYVLYFLLAKFAFPEPDEILGLAAKQSMDDVMDNTINDQTNDLESDLLLLEESHSDDTPNKSNNSNNKKITTARNRKVEKGPTAASTAIANGSDPAQIKTTVEAKDNTSTSEEPKEKQQSQDYCRTLSRYSSGADLESTESKRAWRVAMLLWLSLSVHNFPEGLAVAASAMESPQLGLKVTIGIMVHNIPEGISIAVPCLAARPDSPWLAFWLAALSGLAEPFGAFVALFALQDIGQHHAVVEGEWPPIFSMENVLAFVAGIMIMVAAVELFPEAMRHTQKGYYHFILGTVMGFLLMLATELYMN